MYVALLRGVNVGGKNPVPMKDLATLFAAEGCGEVKTYIQSGNVVFNHAGRNVDGLADRLSRRIKDKFSCNSPVLLRTSAELADVISSNPYLRDGSPEASLHVYFLAAKPGIDAVAQLDPERSPGDTFVVRGREIYLKLPNGMARSKLTNAYFDTRLKTVSTARNWRTVLKLAEMCG